MQTAFFLGLGNFAGKNMALLRQGALPVGTASMPDFLARGLLLLFNFHLTIR